MNIYFDTEFTGLVPNTTLISIGLVTENDDKFYAEFTDYDRNLITPWIEENVISHLCLKKGDSILRDKVKMFSGSTYYIWNRLAHWLEQVSGALYELYGDGPKNLILMNPEEAEQIQFVSDVCHYDMYLLCNQIFGGAFNLPKNVNPVCYDICQDICMRAEKDRKELWYPDTDGMYSAFDISREALCKKLNGELPAGQKHNALYDAKVIKMIYEGMRK